MGDNVFINGRAAVHKGSIGKSIAFPDVCLCPPAPPAGPVPTPLTNTAKAADLDGCATTVTIEGNRVAHAQSFVARSTGDEVAQSTGGGIITHTTQGKAFFQTYSRNVMICGQPAVRHLDLLTHNHVAKAPGNTPPTPWMSKMIAGGGPAPKESVKDAKEGKDWLEIAMSDPDGDPLPGLRYRVNTPKGKIVEGFTPTTGKARIIRLSKGKCKVEWLDDVADVAKDGKTILLGTPATDNVTTGASYKYVLKLQKIRVRVLDHSGEPCKNAKCDLWIRPFIKNRHSTDGNGWLELWCPVKAEQIEFRMVRPYESEKRRLHLRPPTDDDKTARKQRLHNLGFFAASEPEENADMFGRTYGIDESEANLAKHLADIESHCKSADNPRDKRLQPLTEPQHDLSDVGERT